MYVYALIYSVLLHSLWSSAENLTTMLSFECYNFQVICSINMSTCSTNWKTACTCQLPVVSHLSVGSCTILIESSGFCYKSNVFHFLDLKQPFKSLTLYTSDMIRHPLYFRAGLLLWKIFMLCAAKMIPYWHHVSVYQQSQFVLRQTKNNIL